MGKATRSRISAGPVFLGLLVLLLAAALGVGLSWGNQRRLSRTRNDFNASLLNIRDIRDAVQTACRSRLIMTMTGDSERINLLGEVADGLEHLDRDAAEDPQLREIADHLRRNLAAFDTTLAEVAASATTPGSMEQLAFALDGELQKSLTTISAARERLTARYEAVSTAAYDNAVFVQASMLAVLFVALAGIGIGALLVRRENRRRDRVEHELRESESKLERAEQITSIGYWVNDRLAKTVAGSAEYFRIYGLPYTDLVPVQTIFDRIHPDDIDAILRNHRELEADPGPRTVEYRILRDGQVRHIVAHITCETEPGGRILRTFGTVQDVTEQRLAQADARAWRTRFEAAVRSARQMVYERDPRADSICWQGACGETLGLEPEAIGNLVDWKSRLHPDDLPRFETELRRSAHSGAPFSLEYRVRHADGRYIYVLDRSQRIPSGDGAPHVFGLVIDMSDRKRLEEELLQAQKLESIGRLAGGVAHDLNNWLTAILGYAGLARIDREVSHLAEYLERIERAGNSAAKMTNQLLAFARRKIIEPRICSLNDIIHDAWVLLRPLLGENIQVRTIPADSLWKVRVDPGQFEQVIVNLALNARDAMPAGGRLTIETLNVELDDDYSRTHPEVIPGQHVMLAISDTGNGIPANQIGRVFEPFYTTKPRGSGTGLGLATVLGLVKQHGGHIWVYSEVGKGTTFKVYIPRHLGEQPRPAAPARAQIRSSGHETILVVEDESLVRELAVAALREQGYQILEADNAQRALEFIRSHSSRIHLIVTDVIMPGMSGKQLAEAAQTARPETRILYTSGYTDNVVVHHAILDDGVNFLQKPYTPILLAAKVREVLDAQSEPAR
ncbi:MAG: PAS domain-containing protein [Phycisphaerales bacterium]|nr:PAS domain-containing protein [Phycisphaerales bacterium]